MIRLAVPAIDDTDVDAVGEVLRTGYLVQGPSVAALEERVLPHTGAEHLVMVSSGTAALHLALLALDVRPGDRVVVPTYSWVATANVGEVCGAEVVFVDIDPRTFAMDPAALAAALERLHGDGGGPVRAVIPVHPFGLMADMTAISEVCSRWEVPVVEDAACALGATQDGRPAGSWGDMGCFSFHPRKAVTTGEGGGVTTGDPRLDRRLRALRNHGLDPEATGPDFVLPGLNYRMTEFQAALGLVQMGRFEALLADRRRGASRYDELFEGTSVLSPTVPAGFEHSYQSYVVLLPEEVAPRRARLIAALREEGIESTIGTWHIPLTTYWSQRYGFRRGDFPTTDAVFDRSLTIPLGAHVSAEDQEVVVEAVLRHCR
ncbi:MAG: DegT/DnrJ/EryC1/StrS family aminotransferase [Micrococcales bacterium]|nr:DegT/DnrJ/EryC1/StrS family aminotransferase [Micrococcales bacterium]